MMTSHVICFAVGLVLGMFVTFIAFILAMAGDDDE